MLTITPRVKLTCDLSPSIRISCIANGTPKLPCRTNDSKRQQKIAQCPDTSCRHKGRKTGEQRPSGEACWVAAHGQGSLLEPQGLGPYVPQGSTSLLPKLSVTSKVSTRTSYAWVGSRVHFRSSEDVTLFEFTSPVDREYMRRRRKFH